MPEVIEMYILAKGDSMLPTLTDGEYYRIEPIDNGEISPKDIIVFNIDGITICHRVLQVYEPESQTPQPTPAHIHHILQEVHGQ